MVVHRGEVWWADLGQPRGSAPGFRRPVLIVQSDAFNQSRIRTVLCVMLTSNLALLAAPGNVLVENGRSGLPKDSVANVSQVVTLDRDHLVERVGQVGFDLLAEIDAGLRLVLDL
ncbi:MAG TPA: type II toxin-antitoxin system PemK/MazF family toxin [Trueperaceae bacterium]|nr:type II toxin-antitoxin system PemK/MazF family toxin [Trueperaceae bacterium]